MRRFAQVFGPVFVAFVLLSPSAMAVEMQPDGGITEDGACFIWERYEYSAKWLSNVTRSLEIQSFHGALGTMTNWLYDPDGVLRASYNPPRNTYYPTIYKYNLNNHYNATGKVSGKWHLHWHGHMDGDLIQGDDYIYVGMTAIQRTTAVGTNYNEQRQLAIGLTLPTYDGSGVAVSLAITLRDVLDGGSPRRDLRIRIAENFQDNKITGSHAENHIEEMQIYIAKVAFEGYGTTGTGTGGSWYNSGIYIDSLYGRNVSLPGGVPAYGYWAFALTVLALSTWVFPGAFTVIASVVMGELMHYGTITGNPDQAPYHNGGDTRAFSDYHKDGHGLSNASAFNNASLQWDSSKGLSYCFMIWGHIIYENYNIVGYLASVDLPALYIVLRNS